MNWRVLSTDELEREYSPSSMVGDIDPLISWYADESARSKQTLGNCLHEDLYYGPDPDETLDLFLPTPDRTNQNSRLVVFVHGGYWQQLSKNEHAFPACAWISTGSAFATINYGLAPESSISQMVSRCRRALNWLGQKGDHYGFDAQRISVIGHSAGAHLLACAISPDIAGHNPETLITRPEQAILIGGIYDLEPICHTYVNEPLKLSPHSARALSPQFHDPDPSVFITVVYAEHETTEFIRQSRAYADKCSKTVSRSTLIRVVGRHHFDIMYDISRTDTGLFQQIFSPSTPET